MSNDRPLISLRKFLAALLALAVLLSPVVTSAAAVGAGVNDHQIQMMESGHCSSMPSDHHEKSDGKSCCISTYLGVAIAPAAPHAEMGPSAPQPVSFIPPLHRPCLSEIATPPPRQA